MALGNANVPFLDVQSFNREEGESKRESLTLVSNALRPGSNLGAVQSPFISVYELNGEQEYEDPLREAYVRLVDQLHDEEFDEALFEASTELRGLHQNHLASGYSNDEAERLVTRHFASFISEAEAAVTALGESAARIEGEASNYEVDAFVASYVPGTLVEPAFENLFGKILKKVGGAIKAVGGAALRKIFTGRIKGFLKPFLLKVLQRAIGKLPAPLQPVALKLAQRFGVNVPGARKSAVARVNRPPAQMANSGADAGGVNTVHSPEPVPAGDTVAPIDAATAPSVSPSAVASPSVQGLTLESPAQVQQELDQLLAEVALGESEVETSFEVGPFTRTTPPPAPVFSELEQARERFISELENLREGESAAPHIQNFVPLLLPALQLGFRLGGRKIVVNIVSQLLAQLLKSLVGPAPAQALSRAIVDAGLKLLNLEMSEQEQSRLSASAVAATVEETVARVAALPEYILENRELLEGFTLEAFEHAAAANLPAVLSESSYAQRPELLEAGVNAAWFMRPSHRPRYKRCSRKFKVKITPHMAEEIETFEGLLADYLQDQLGVPEGETVEAEVHLFEALAGATIADIAGGETEVSGLGAADEATLAQFHPLTHEAAARILGRSSLGRSLPQGAQRRHLFAGQRLYHLAIPGRRPLSVGLHAGRQRVRRLAHMKVTFDTTAHQIKVSIFLSERKAQKLAMKLRQAAHSGAVAVWFNKFLSRRLGSVLYGHRPRRLRIIHSGVIPNAGAPEAASAVIAKLPSVVQRALVAKVAEWLLHAFMAFTKNQSSEYLSAADDAADGVTLRFTIENPQGLKELAAALVENGQAATVIADTLNKAIQPAVRVEVVPGHKCD